MASVLPKMELNRSSAAAAETMKKSQMKRYSRQLLSSIAYCRLRNRLSNGYCKVTIPTTASASTSASSSSPFYLMEKLNSNALRARPHAFTLTQK